MEEINDRGEREIFLFVERWNVQMLAESFNQSVDNVRLILQQRTKRGMRVRARSPSSLFGVKDEEQAEKLMREHLLKRDLVSHRKSTLPEDDGDPVDHQILAEESQLISRRRPSNAYLERDVSEFIAIESMSPFFFVSNRTMGSFPM